MAMFKGFKPQGLQKIATRMGYAGSMENFDDYLKQNPDKEREMIVYRSKAQEMAKGGAVVKKMQEGGFVQPIDYFLPGTNPPLAPGETRMGEVNPAYTGGQTNVMQPISQQPTPTQTFTEDMDITDVAAQRMSAPGLPSGAQVVGQGVTQEAGQFIPTTQGQVTGAVAVP